MGERLGRSVVALLQGMQPHMRELRVPSDAELAAAAAASSSASSSEPHSANAPGGCMPAHEPVIAALLQLRRPAGYRHITH